MNNCSSSGSPVYTLGSRIHYSNMAEGHFTALGPWETGAPGYCMCSTGPFGSFLASSETKSPNKSADRTGIAKTIPLSYLKAIVKLPSLQSSSESKYILFSDQRHTSKRIKPNSKKQEENPIMCTMHRSRHT